MKDRKFAMLTVGGLLAEIGCGVLLTILGALTGMMYTDLLIFALIGAALCIALGSLYAVIAGKARELHVSMQTFTLVSQIIPVTLSICCLIALPLLVLLKIIGSGMALTAVLSVSVGAILTAVFSRVFTAIIEKKKK